MPEIYLGVLSGTSIDAVDVAAVDFDQFPFKLLGTHSEKFPSDLRSFLNSLCQPGIDEINRLGQVDKQVGLLFSKACNALLAKINLTRDKVCAIGSHGQTIRHQPTSPFPFTLQIGDPNVIAAETNIMTIADFRRRDMTCGGQGAPLTPAFHRYAFQSPDASRVVVNIGGIANLTVLPQEPSEKVLGFDCGPGNTLLDEWIKTHTSLHYDQGGYFASQGQISDVLFSRLLEDPYFQQPPPKSTGREYFNLSWLENKLQGLSLLPQDIQSTLAELTATTIMNAIEQYAPKNCEILICGGGVHNLDLLNRLNARKGGHSVATTSHLGVDPDWVEAIAFAWLARQTANRLPGNIPEVTGAKSSTILGGIYPV